MLRYLFITICLMSCISSMAQAPAATACCPEFSLVQFNNITPCSRYEGCNDQQAAAAVTGNVPGTAPSMTYACKNSQQTYTVIPNLPGFTYSWQVTGGTPTSFTGNPAVITWGPSSQGTLQVIISDASGTCRDTIRRNICLLDAPQASFVPIPGTTVCLGTPVQFNNTSTGGTSYYWEFGDGGTSTSFSPQHTYTATGAYTVRLTVSNSSGQLAGRCGCSNVYTMVINVVAGAGTSITTSCKKMLCYNDTATYCVTPACPPFSWTVNGGTIIANNGSCVTVRWNTLPTTWPSSISVTTGCVSACGSSATLAVPVLYPSIPIEGRNLVCPGSTTSYSLPALPGTFYSWSLSGGGTITPYDSNHNVINIQWGFATGGPHIITCNYSNPYTGCSGSDTFAVYIRPPFSVYGNATVCQNTLQGYGANGNANWYISPTAGYSPPGSPPGTFINTSSLSLTWNTPGTYNMNVVPVTPTNYCNSSSGISVIVNPVPVLNPITGTTTVCPGQLYDYSVSSNVTGGNYVWAFTTGTGSASAYGPNNSLASVSFTGPGPWVLQASQTAAGCTGSTSLNIAPVAAPPAISLSAPSICSGGNITASVSGPLPPGGYTWSATPGAVLLSGQGTTSAVFRMNSSAVITVTNCTGSSTASVTVSPFSVSATATAAPCSSILTASPAGGTYTWFRNGAPAGSGSPLTVTQNGTYVLQATYPSGCSATSSVTVTGITPVVVNITALGNICTGAVTFTASVQANCPSPVFTWSNGFIGNPMTTSTPGTYSVTVNCSNGCTAVSNSISVSCTGGGGSCTPDIIITQNPQVSCSNPVTFTASAPPCTPASTVWNWGDGTSSTSNTHAYTNVGNYIVQGIVTCTDGTRHCDTARVTVPMVDSFTSVISCGTGGWSIQLQDATLFLPAYAGYTRVWSTTCGTLSSTTAANPVLTVPIGCNPTVTLQISRLGCTLNKSFTFSFPTTTFSIVGPSLVCRGQNNTFSSSLTTNIISYSWNFGDATTGVTNPIPHAYNGTPPNPTLQLTITDRYGCQFTTTKPITVYTPPALAISPSPLVQICPDCVTPTPLTATAGFTGYQWYRNGVAITGANTNVYTLCNFNAAGNYTVSALSNPNNCPVTSNTVQVVYKPKPLADIQGTSVQCVSGTGPYYTVLRNSTANDPNYTYNWTGSGPGSVTFTPNNTTWQVNAAVSAIGTYQFIVTVTDITTGCIARDTLCVIFYQSPVVSVSAPSNMCEGTSYTFTASATPVGPAYQYVWSNGVTGNTMTTSAAGNYYVTVTDPVSGCSSMAYAGTIKPLPYTALFPIGCDTICNGDTIVPPLPLGPSQTYNSLYIINWYEGATLVHTGPNLPASLLSPIPGLHVLRIEVVFAWDNCVSVSGNYQVYIKNCNGCDCKDSKWGNIVITGGGQTIQTHCQMTVPLKCNTPYTISPQFYCVGSDDCAQVTYKLQPPTGAATTGNAPFTFTPTQSGLYTLTLYGWCGNKICDSCVIKFEVQCSGCNCNGSYWKQISMTTNTVSQLLDCGKTYSVDDCSPLTFNALFECANPDVCDGTVTHSLRSPSGTIVSTGGMPFSYNPSVDGVYTLTLYGWCGGKICDSCVIRISVKNCHDDCPCDGSYWEQVSVTTNTVSQLLSCGDTYKVDDCSPLTFNALFQCHDPAACSSHVTYKLQSPMGTVIGTGGLPFTYNPTADGIYTLTLYGWCGNKICDSCVIRLDIKGCPDNCDCKKSSWKQISMTTSTVSQLLECDRAYDVPDCGPITFNAQFECPDPADLCGSLVTYNLEAPGGSITTGTMPFTFIPPANGWYTLTLYGWCGGKLCSTCVIRFYVANCPDDCKCDNSGFDKLIFTNTLASTFIDCGKDYTAVCDRPFTIEGGYKCGDPDKCPGAVLYSMQPPTGPAITGTLPFTYVPPVPGGTYTVTLYGYCGNKLCKICTIRVLVLCDGTGKPVVTARGIQPVPAATAKPVDEVKPPGRMVLQPNPARDLVRITVPEKHQQATILVTDLTGKPVITMSRRNNNNGLYDVTIQGLPAGTYIVKLVTGTATYTARLVKE